MMENFDKISVQDHKSDLLGRLNEYRGSGSFCDAILVAQGREFLVHRAVLAACGGFFAGLFTANMREHTENKVELNDLDSDTVENVLNFVYTGEIELSPEKAMQIMKAADYLLLEKLKVAIDHYMSRAVKDISTDYFCTYQFALKYNCVKLEKAVMDFIVNNFEAAWMNSQTAIDTGFETLREMISNEDLVVHSEEIVLRAVLDWVKHKTERKEVFYELFSCVRICSLSKEFLYSSVLSENLVISDPKCLRLVMESMENRSLPTTANVQHPRACLDSYTDAVVVFPTKPYQVAKGPWCFIPSTGEWYQIPTSSDFGYGVAVYDEKGAMLLVQPHLYQIDKFDIATNKWSHVHNFCDDSNIISFSVCYFQGVFFFIGGRKANSFAVSDVRTLSLSSEETSSVASLNVPRSEASVVCDKDNIYVLCGKTFKRDPNSNGFNWNCSFETYDPKLDTWTVLAPAKYLSIKDSCLLSNGKIYRILGITKTVYNYNEVYDIDSNTWSEIPKSLHTLAGGLMVKCDKELFVIGGATIPPGSYDSCSKIPNNERLLTLSYHQETEKWCSRSDKSLKNQYNGGWLLRLTGATVRIPKSNIAKFKPLTEAQP